MSDLSTEQSNTSTMTDSTPALADYLASPDAVLKDEGVQWRYGQPPDYSKTRRYWKRSKKMNHAAGSLPQLVENLVKNWEIEASFKPRLEDWRTIDHQHYAFAMNGDCPQPAEHMLKVGTYNAIIAPNKYYSPEYSNFAESHKTFKRMMPTFAWEVIEVYSGPPTVAFKWRHWGEMKNDYVGVNDKGVKVRAKAHGGPIEIFGVTVANVDSSVRLQSVQTWMDPMEMFRQIVPNGIIEEEAVEQSKEDTQECPREHGDSKQPEFQHINGIHGKGKESEDILEHPVEVCPFAGHSHANGHPMVDQKPAQNYGSNHADDSKLETEATRQQNQGLVTTERLLPESLPPTMPPGFCAVGTSSAQSMEEASDPSAASTEIDPADSNAFRDSFTSPGTKRPRSGDNADGGLLRVDQKQGRDNQVPISVGLNAHHSFDDARYEEHNVEPAQSGVSHYQPTESGTDILLDKYSQNTDIERARSETMYDNSTERELIDVVSTHSVFGETHRTDDEMNSAFPGGQRSS